MFGFSLQPEQPSSIDYYTHRAYRTYPRRRSCIFGALTSGAMRAMSSSSLTGVYNPSQPGSNGQMASQGRHIGDGQQDNLAYPGQRRSDATGTEAQRRPGIMSTGANRRGQLNGTGVVGSLATNTTYAGGAVDRQNPGHYEDAPPPPYQAAVVDGRAPQVPRRHDHKGP